MEFGPPWRDPTACIMRRFCGNSGGRNLGLISFTYIGCVCAPEYRSGSGVFVKVGCGEGCSVCGSCWMVQFLWCEARKHVVLRRMLVRLVSIHKRVDRVMLYRGDDVNGMDLIAGVDYSSSQW